MGQHKLLRERYEQHKIKNDYSKYDDKQNQEASKVITQLLNESYTNHSFEYKPHLTYSEIEEYTNIKMDIPFNYANRYLSPDGGVIWMDNKYPILISESKRQGTNNERINEGLSRQANGNAIERLGKNLCGFETLYCNDDILPFACFCWGCDFLEPTVLCKLYTMNQFQSINTIYTDVSQFKRGRPFTIMTKETQWSLEEIIDILLPIVEYSISYFENKE